METGKLEKIIDPKKYRVFLLSSPVPLPLSFAVHTWFVVNIKGDIHRWEFGVFKGSPHPGGLGILRDFLPPEKGMNMFWWWNYPTFKSHIINYIEGDENSIANKLAIFIEKNSKDYPFKKMYRLLGPNSNSYVRWVLDKFPDVDLQLPCNAFGGRYDFSEKDNSVI